MGMRPRLVVFTMIDEPKGKRRSGGELAAPLFRRIAEGILALCGREPTESNPILASSPDFFREFDPEPRKKIRVKRGKQLGEWILPDLKGLNVRQVVDICGKIKCDASFRGSGRVIKQKPAPGAVVKEGIVLEVSFKGQSS